jgi:hypothetical protein
MWCTHAGWVAPWARKARTMPPRRLLPSRSPAAGTAISPSSCVVALVGVLLLATPSQAAARGDLLRLPPPSTSEWTALLATVNSVHSAHFRTPLAPAATPPSATTAASFLQLASSTSLYPGLVGRGRGRGRGQLTYGPEEFDNSWWLAPPSVGPDTFLRGYDQRVYPRGGFGYGGMPNGGFGSGSYFWGGPSYRTNFNVPWSHDMAFNTRARNANAVYSPYLDLADTFGRKNGGGLFPLSSPYVSFPPPLQGDWNMPHSPSMLMAPP